MFKQRDDDEYEARSEGGVRHLFVLGRFGFFDTLDEEGAFHHFILESAEDDTVASYYEVDRDTMYEFMARYLAGEYEIAEYDLEHSPGHDALLDVLEIAGARARAGESEFSWDEFDPAETEVLDNPEEPDEPDEPGSRS